jgi:hypothetical protein
LKIQTVKAKAAAAALWTALLFCAQGARAAAPASDNGSFYQNPWGLANPQNRTSSRFAPWVFDEYNPTNNPPAPNPFFIDTARGAWGIKMEPDFEPPDFVNIFPGYDAAWTSFTGDGQLDPGQTFSTTVLFTPPAALTNTREIPTEAVDFFAQDPSIPSHYDKFGHQVLGIYLGVFSSGTSFILLVHTGKVPTDENPSVIKTIPLPFTGTATDPQKVKITYTQFLAGHWRITIKSGTIGLVLTSHEFGATWNTLGVDAVRYFTSQGGTNPGGPLEWKNRSVSGSGFPF